MIVYEPRAKWTQDSFVAKFIEKAGCKDFPSLLLKSQKDPEWFWELALKDMGLQFRTPYKKLLAEGLPWPKWALGGEISVVENCIDRHLKDHGSDTALIFEADKPGESVSWTFNDLARESHFIAEELKKKGAQKGDRAALLMPMSLEMAAAFFGILRAGLTVVPIFSGYGAEAISSRLEDSKARFIFVQEKTTRRGKEIPVRSTLDEALKTSPSIEHTLILKRADFISQNHQASSSYHSVASPAESPVLLLYTSGTTGKPKACVHTSFGVLATTGKELRYTFDVKRSDRFFWYTDIGWMMGPWELFGVLQYGAAVVLFEGVPDFPEPDRLWKIIDDHQITHLGIAPTAIRVLKKAGDSFVEKHSLKSLRILGSSGETWDEESWKWFFEKVGKTKCPIMNMSGGTEVMGCLLMPTPLSKLKPCSLGGPVLGADIRAFSEEGQPISSGIGHLVCLSPLPSMTKGFLNSPEKYLETYFEKFGEKAWYHGDWAFIDEDGFWFLKGRSDDTIKIAGKRVGPNEFESALMEDNRVAEVAAIGIPHAIKGECVYCYVVLKNTNETATIQTELLERVAKKMGRALAPEKIIFVEALPKTRSGKILRGIIKKLSLGEPVDTASVENLSSLKSIKAI